VPENDPDKRPHFHDTNRSIENQSACNWQIQCRPKINGKVRTKSLWMQQVLERLRHHAFEPLLPLGLLCFGRQTGRSAKNDCGSVRLAREQQRSRRSCTVSHEPLPVCAFFFVFGGQTLEITDVDQRFRCCAAEWMNLSCQVSANARNNWNRRSQKGSSKHISAVSIRQKNGDIAKVCHGLPLGDRKGCRSQQTCLYQGGRPSTTFPVIAFVSESFVCFQKSNANGRGLFLVLDAHPSLRERHSRISRPCCIRTIAVPEA